MREMKFENFSIPLDLDLYAEDIANASWDEVMDYMEQAVKTSFGKFSITRNVERQSFICSITSDMGKTTDAIRCTSQFGKTALSASQKLMYLLEYHSWLERDEDTVRASLDEATLELKMAFKARGK